MVEIGGLHLCLKGMYAPASFTNVHDVVELCMVPPLSAASKYDDYEF